MREREREIKTSKKGKKQSWRKWPHHGKIECGRLVWSSHFSSVLGNQKAAVLSSNRVCSTNHCVTSGKTSDAEFGLTPDSTGKQMLPAH